MKENKYDDQTFFEQYSKMSRSENGLEKAGEWYILKQMLPKLKNMSILDLGCGFGWHCRYAIENGAKSVIGVDISKNMLEKAKKINNLPGIEYLRIPIEDVDYPSETFDVIISSLALHYIKSFDSICNNVYSWLKPNGYFIFSVEHPVFTAMGSQQWNYDENGDITSWPVDNYFYEGKRDAMFLGENVTKYHHTLTTYLNELLKHGFQIKEIIEPQPSEEALKYVDDMKNEMRRPMMLLISARK